MISASVKHAQIYLPDDGQPDNLVKCKSPGGENHHRENDIVQYGLIEQFQLEANLYPIPYTDCI